MYDLTAEQAPGGPGPQLDYVCRTRTGGTSSRHGRKRLLLHRHWRWPQERHG